MARASLVGLALGGLLLSGIPLCPFAYLTGFPCPGCGLTRAGLCLLHGDLRGAIALSPLAPLVVPFAGAVAVRALVSYLRAKPEIPPRWVTRGALAVWVSLLVVWLLRFAGLFGGPVAVTSLWTK